MRILQIRFKNLNSLVGEWLIDLTHPAFVQEGLFAITGPTGAGKSTLLDALCLALYGRTPRLNKVTKSTNEIMSRQTGECFAEVVFVTAMGHYRCHWSQRRARKRAEGELQVPKHEIAYAEGEEKGKLLETRLSEVVSYVTKLTGMDFNQFTRSMLLAQGSFAAFLQATADERSPILEQITGTEIYSHLSIFVHETYVEARKAVELMQAELSGLSLLSVDDINALQCQLNTLQQQAQELQTAIHEQQKCIQWLENLMQLEASLQQLTAEKIQLDKRKQDFVPQHNRLSAANRALALAVEYAAIQTLRQQQQRDRERLEAFKTALPFSLQQQQQAEAVYHQENTRLNDCKTEQQTQRILINQVRLMDEQLDYKQQQLNKLASVVRENEQQYHHQKQYIEQESALLEQQRQQWLIIQTHFQEHQSDARLITELTALQQRFEQLQQQHRVALDLAQHVKQLDAQCLAAAEKRQQTTEQFDKQQHSYDELQHHYAVKQVAWLESLEGQTLKTWRERKAKLSDEKQQLLTLLAADEAQQNAQQALELIHQQQIDKQQQSTVINLDLKMATEQSHALESEQGLLETQLILLNKIASLEEARHQLKKGEPCPLCGALDHPFVSHELPTADITHEKLVRVKHELKKVREKLLEHQRDEARISHHLLQLAQEQKQKQAQYDDALQSYTAYVQQLSEWIQAEALDVNDHMTLKMRVTSNETAISHIDTVIQRAEQQEEALKNLQEQQWAAQGQLMQLKQAQQEAILAHQKLADMQQHQQEALNNMQQKIDQEINLLQEKIEGFDLGETLTIHNIESILQQLIERHQQWQTWQANSETLNRQMMALTLKIQHAQQRLTEQETVLKQQQADYAQQKHDYETYKCQRQKIFGERSPDEEEQILLRTLEFIESSLKTAHETWHQQIQVVQQQQNQISFLTETLTQTALNYQSMMTHFEQQLTNKGFESEASYQAACLTDNERNALSAEADELTQTEQLLLAALAEKSALYQQEKAKHLSQKSLQQLSDDLNQLMAQYKICQQEIGAVCQTLTANQIQQERQQQQLAKYQAYEREYARWQALHALIGSSDGKKYRNFAQGLTFARVVFHANQQLQKMTDRYLLVREDHQPLELSVVDSYQAGVIRSTKNLSGGESFIVSLALALGLAQMASQNIRVESLFLDEGFGTLDEDALETALNTLAGLQHEGKLIGVISHVAALKTRIHTQIKVVPQAGGRSFLQGVGCFHLGE